MGALGDTDTPWFVRGHADEARRLRSPPDAGVEGEPGTHGRRARASVGRCGMRVPSTSWIEICTGRLPREGLATLLTLDAQDGFLTARRVRRKADVGALGEWVRSQILGKKYLESTLEKRESQEKNVTQTSKVRQSADRVRVYCAWRRKSLISLDLRHNPSGCSFTDFWMQFKKLK